ncbi:hypothetical protein ABIB80_007495 [Bradyrhizobium sp. i1.15.2]
MLRFLATVIAACCATAANAAADCKSIQYPSARLSCYDGAAKAAPKAATTAKNLQR